MSRYSIALGKVPGKRTRKKVKKNSTYSVKKCQSFNSAVDMYNYMCRIKGEWEAETIFNKTIVYNSVKDKSSIVITVVDWNKTKHFVPVSFSIKIELRETVLLRS